VRVARCDARRELVYVVGQVPGGAPKGETRVHRCPGYEGALEGIPYKDEPDVNTVPMALRRAALKFPERNFLGERTREKDGKRGQYVWQTYGAAYPEIQAIGHGLKSECGLVSSAQSGETQARLGIYGINRSEWTKLLLASFSQRVCVAPLYDTLGANACTFIIGHAELTTVACERSKLDNMLKSKGSLANFVNIILFEDPTAEEVEKAKLAGVTLRGMSDLTKAGIGAAKAEEGKVPAGFPKPEDWGYIMYTSGTTGDPKGVVLSHQNIISSSGGLLRQNPHLDLLRPDDVYLSFLPLAHSFETCMQVCCILVGCGIGFYQGDARKLVSDDMPDLQPTIMAAVPRIYARIYDKVMAGVEAKGWLAKTLFSWGMGATSSRFIFEAILFKKLQKVVGGRIRLMASGAAPLSADLHKFLTQVFGCPVLQGYGMTENCAAAVVQPLGYRKGGNVGGPTPCVEVKLQDTEDYKCTDVYPGTKEAFERQVSFKGEFDPAKAGKIVQRGEVCLRGLNVFVGYYKNEKETQETKDSDGWLHTGDIGVWNADGSLSIVDRKKNIFKLAQGEYVSPESVEGAVTASKWCGQVWVYGNSFESYVVAIVVPDMEVFTKWLKEAHPGLSTEEAVKKPEVKKMILDDLIATGKAAKLRGFELPKDIDFECTVNDLGQGFTVDKELLTPTLKFRRPQLLKYYQAKIDAMYAGPSFVASAGLMRG